MCSLFLFFLCSALFPPTHFSPSPPRPFPSPVLGSFLRLSAFSAVWAIPRPAPFAGCRLSPRPAACVPLRPNPRPRPVPVPSPWRTYINCGRHAQSAFCWNERFSSFLMDEFFFDYLRASRARVFVRFRDAVSIFRAIAGVSDF